jgi:PIN domain nuclease of toxin-antitoxin system
MVDSSYARAKMWPSADGGYYISLYPRPKDANSLTSYLSNGVRKPSVSSVVDASALLAYLNDEAGAEVVASALEAGCFISSVNLTEVFSKVAELGGKPKVLAQRLEGEGILHQTLKVVDYGYDDTFEASLLRPTTKTLGLSLGDRVCLALGTKLDLPVLTADAVWTKLKLRVTVRLIR